MILEGAMIIIATSCLTFLHPGIVFAGAWNQLNFHFRSRKSANGEKNMDGVDTPEFVELVMDPSRPNTGPGNKYVAQAV